MNTYESHIVQVKADAADIFAIASDMRNLDRVKHLIPGGMVQELETEKELVRLKLDGLGQKITFLIVDRIGKPTAETDDSDLPPATDFTVKYGIDNPLVQGNIWIQTKQVAPGDSRLKLTMKAELPTMIAMMAGSKLQAAIDQAADLLSQMPFSQWAAER